MEIVRRLYTSKFFTRLISYFLLILMVGFVFVFIITMRSWNQTKEQIENQLQEKLDVSSSVVGSQVMMALRTGSAFFQDTNTIMFFKPYKDQTVESLSEVWKVQESIKKSENTLAPLVHSIFAYFPSDATVMTSAGLYDQDFYFSSINDFLSYDQMFWNSEIPVGDRRLILPQTTLKTRSGTVDVLPIITVSRLSGETVIHVCNVVSDYLKQLLSNHGFEDYHMVIINERGAVLMEIGTPAPSAFEIKSTHDDLGWTFVESVDRAAMRTQMGNAFLPTIFLMLLLFVGGIALVVVLSFRIYKPIEDMKHLLNTEESGRFDELIAIKHGMKELIDKEDYHSQQEQTHLLEQSRQRIHMLLHGIQPKDITQTVEYLVNYRGFIDGSYMCCSVLIEYNQSFFTSFTAEQQSVFRNAIPTVLRTSFREQLPVMVIPFEADFHQIVINLESLERKEFVFQLLQIPSIHSHHYSLYFGLGNAVDSLDKLHISYAQAVAALQERNNELTYQVIDFAKLPQQKKVAFSFYDQQGIVNNIKTGNADQLKKYIFSLIEKNEQRMISPANMTELYRQILLVGRRALEERGGVVSDIPRYDELSNMLVTNLDEAHLQIIKGEMFRLFRDIQETIYTSESKYHDNKVIEDIQQYIKEHYHQPLSLEIVAEHFDITPKYLSRLFKEETKINFSAYITDLRIEIVKEQLRNTNKKIGDIAKDVGIDSRATFLRLFKKVEGISPNEYRNLKKK